MGTTGLARVLGQLHGAGFPDGWREQLFVLEELLERWGPRLSLTGFEDADERARRYFEEAIAAAEFVPARGRALDVGSGGGSPALPLAIVRPHVAWLLAESRQRKAGFLVEAVERLALQNVRVEARRVNHDWPRESFDVVTTRGVALQGALLEAVRSKVGAEGAHLWFSSEKLLRHEASRLAAETGWVAEGPFRLQRGVGPSSGWLLVCRRHLVPAEPTECFT